jgi:acyl carrier protein
MHNSHALSAFTAAQRHTGGAVDCAAARHILAAAAGVSAERIFPQTRLDHLIGDSLVLEMVVFELEEHLGCEADRVALWKLETVEDLARHMFEIEAMAQL